MLLPNMNPLFLLSAESANSFQFTGELQMDKEGVQKYIKNDILKALENKERKTPP